MAQHDMNIINAGFPAVRSDINSALSAIQTNHSGTSRPTGAVAGQIWLDTTNATSPTLKFYDGTDDISLATIDYSANTVNWLDSTVSITGLATTATGTVLTLSDTATTQTVNFIIDNEKEIRFSEADGNGSNYVALKAPASLASDVTFTLPSADGTANQVLTTDGSGVLSFAASSAGLEWQSTIVTISTLTAVANKGYWIDTTSNACTITLPASASVGDQIIFSDYARTWGTNAITINQNSLNFQGVTSPNPEYNTSGQSVSIVYSGATKGWIPISDDDVTDESIIPLEISYLVVAGGGSGGAANAGGGGAGGYLTNYGVSTITLQEGEVYTITVGAGGASVSNPPGVIGNSGSNSELSGTGIATITAIGGGYGGRSSQGGSGGSGGGNSYNITSSGGSGTVGQGNDGGSGSPVGPEYGGGGGGGAGAVGGNGTTTVGGAGGVGLSNSITGSATFYAGGGGGSTEATTGSAGAGGNGGGGAGAAGHNGIAGTSNTGGGGGGTNNATSGAGGSGVVILRLPTADYSSTTTGSPTVTTDGTDTIIKFTASGSYTA
jgi:hypothetical protein